MPDGPIGGVQMPGPIRALRRNKVGYPIPFFVADNPETGEADFRLTDITKMIRCINDKLCWICGQRLRTTATFVVGPMCVVNRISAEPPSHQDCALYAARVCPFMTRPNMVRREGGLPTDHYQKDGFIAANPGVMALWTTRKWTALAPEKHDGYYFTFGMPARIMWMAEGRAAARSEVLASLERGFPTILEQCTTDEQKADARRDLERVRAHLLPQEHADG